MKKSFFILLIITLLFSCSKINLNDTIFIHDRNDYNLPAYTEMGYNSFGAQYERDYFLVSQKIVPCKILYKDENLHFALSGTIRDDQEMTLTFVFPSEKMNDYSDLLQLNDIIINTVDDECIIIMKQGNIETTLENCIGWIHFKRAQMLTIDDEANRVILSGFFALTFLENGFPVDISNGRFDVGITDKVFYAY